MRTRLVEFKNKSGNLLRGILASGGSVAKKAVVFLHGFERAATTEKKFKTLSDRLINSNIASLRFDNSGCGLSDGEFEKMTIKSMTDDFHKALEFIRKGKIENIVVVAHSLSACIVANSLKNYKNPFSKIVLIAPALNQKDLLRYWFVKNLMKTKDKKLEIDWQNFRHYLNEDEFKKDCLKEDKMAKANYISNDYFLENMNIDYSPLLKETREHILHIHGDKDDKVPLESLNIIFPNSIIVKDGDHDLERPDMINQWLNQCVSFIK